MIGGGGGAVVDYSILVLVSDRVWPGTFNYSHVIVKS